jgi:hypothetical protein
MSRVPSKLVLPVLLVAVAALPACGNKDAPRSLSTRSATSGMPPTIDAPVHLQPGDPAPAFKLQGSDGKEHALADSLGLRVVVLAWFPKAFTGG